MIISESWLREWVSPDLSTAELAELLTQAGLEVETVIPQTLLGDKVVVGEITAIEKHPDADKLNVCTVEVGDAQALTIVCGAPNARKGLIAPVSLVGAVLPNGMEIGARKVRGIASSGMICSAAELDLEDAADGLMELDANAPVGTRLDDYLQLQDSCIDIDLTPDRGDCLSMSGVARDVAALSKAPVTELNIQPVTATIDDQIDVDLQAAEVCPRYAGRVIKGVNLNAQTPDAIKEKLRRSGVRSISPIVDVTNYVMLELGQPMHAFDLNKLQGGIVVRMAKPGEKLELLDGQEVELQDGMLVIADHDKAVALAGIMGGGNSEIDENTTDILLESAYFSPLVIAGKARMLGLHTDASHRFERGVDTHLQVIALERATQLLLDIVGGEAGPVVDAVSQENLPEIQTISLRPQRVRAMLGLDVPDEAIKQHLLDLKMRVNDDSLPWQVRRPSWRFDVTGEHDLVEEIGRLEGLDKIQPNMPTLRARPFSQHESDISAYTLKTWLASCDYREVVCYSFIAPEDQLVVSGEAQATEQAIDLANPIASNMAQMRLSLLPGLLNAARSNEQRQHSRIRLFEMGHSFAVDHDSDTGAREISNTALLAGGARHGVAWDSQASNTDFFDIKGDLDALFDRIGILAGIEYRSNSAHPALHPGQAADIYLNGEMVGFIGTLHPTVQAHFGLKQSYVLAQIVSSALQHRAIPSFKRLSKFPETTRDLALIVENDVLAGDILNDIRENVGNVLKKCELFDTYRGENIPQGSKSLAFSLSLQSDTESLGSEFVEDLMAGLLKTLSARHGATLRN